MSKEKPRNEHNIVCCQLTCKKPAEWEIYTKDDNTVACTEHVGELLTDAKEHRIFRFPVMSYI